MKCILCHEEGQYATDLRCEDVFCKTHHDLLAQAEARSIWLKKFFMEQQHKNLIQEYVQQKDLIREAEERIKELQFALKQFIEVDDVFDTDIATLSMVKGRTSYRYSENVQAREEALKADKKLEEQTGVAEAIEGEPYIIVKFKKL